ncbi:MAG: hypothetical protein JO025_21655 [Verrucomicrobia bacterium]|nr:hypothetical protein [Verrucomicrobiota bacterium]
MSFTQSAKAVVVSCSVGASEQITVDVTVTLFNVEARVLDHKFYEEVYMVRVTKPEGVGDLIDEEGNLMEHGKFSFDSTEEIPIDTELEVEITGIFHLIVWRITGSTSPDSSYSVSKFDLRKTKPGNKENAIIRREPHGPGIE